MIEINYAFIQKTEDNTQWVSFVLSEEGQNDLTIQKKQHKENFVQIGIKTRLSSHDRFYVSTQLDNCVHLENLFR